jgi:hypothetical protein
MKSLAQISRVVIVIHFVDTSVSHVPIIIAQILAVVFWATTVEELKVRYKQWIKRRTFKCKLV